MIKISKTVIYILGFAAVSSIVTWLQNELIREIGIIWRWYRSHSGDLYIYPYLVFITTTGYFLARYGLNETTKRLGLTASALSITLIYINTSSLPIALYFLLGSAIVCGFDFVKDGQNA